MASISCSGNTSISDIIEYFENGLDQDLSGEDLFLCSMFKSSKIASLDDHYFTCARISYNLNISQNEINELDFWEYTNLVVYLTRIIQEENEHNGVSHKDATSNYQDTMRSQQNAFKSQMANMKMPKPKI